MIELLTKEQQEKVITHLTQLINAYLEKEKHIYVILEPIENDEINDIFFESGANYTEPVMLFDERVEDIGPRISELGKNKKFDSWVIEKALFYRWTGLFISDVDLERFTKHISYLCNAVTFEHKSVIFRMYPPIILNEWLMALQKESRAYQALGFCSDIFYIMDFPEHIAHYHFENNIATRQKIDLLSTRIDKITLSEKIDAMVIRANKKWRLTKNQVSSLSYARVYHLVHKFRKHFFSIESIQEKYLVQEVHEQILRIIRLCFNYQIAEPYLMQGLIELYFNYTERWTNYEEKIISILEECSPKDEILLENIGKLLILNESINQN